ncbi:OsmC family protein [Pyrofollis japonicus]|uniref:OsmC family protein n=1 Tax=Pyrofollis japonicus TaxID=3060460 RepID=UPI00295BD870|nr:OsmC family protein [Pyrofollis japonicus]BEP18334.1 OsmC family protein [Pyrofollis japonicus]
MLHIVVETQSTSGFRVEARARNHVMMLDEPRELGGTDEGPSPLEALLGALAACITMVTRLHATRRGIEVGLVEARAEADVDPRGFVGKAKPGLQNIRLTIRVQGKAPKEVLEKLVREAEKCCPVADTLRSETPISLEIRVEESNP